MSKLLKLVLCTCFALVLLNGCGGSSNNGKVVIYSNADEEAQRAIKNALDDNGFKDQYIMQTFGTSELGGKIIAEGKNIEANLITMSSYYIDSAQQQNDMFVDLIFEKNTINETPNYSIPMIAIEGTIILNTELLTEKGLARPTSIKDLAKPEYAGYISIVDMAGSSTGWLLVQSLISEYGEEEAKVILNGIIKNAGPHLEKSGSGPIKKVRAGEVAIAFGLRHQAVADKEKGLPIDYVDPIEGNFALTESLAVVKKDDEKTQKAQEMAECIMKNARPEIIENYPIPLYNNEKVGVNSANTKYYKETLTVDLLEKHLAISEECKRNSQN